MTSNNKKKLTKKGVGTSIPSKGHNILSFLVLTNQSTIRYAYLFARVFYRYLFSIVQIFYFFIVLKISLFIVLFFYCANILSFLISFFLYVSFLCKEKVRIPYPVSLARNIVRKNTHLFAKKRDTRYRAKQ